MTTYSTPANIHTALVALIGPLPVPLTRSTGAAYLDRWAATCLHLAEMAADTAEYALTKGLSDVASDAKAEAEQFMAEFQHINSMRVNPV